MESQSITKTYRQGAIGALMDEYERAALELKDLIARIPEDDFARIVDAETSDEGCRSAQTIMSHVVRAVYGYAYSIRKLFYISGERPSGKLLSHQESLEGLDAGLRYTAQTLEGRWQMTDEEIMATVIKSGWGVTYDVEQFLEHAIVHILRHRRQIEKFVHQGLIRINTTSAS